MNDIKFEWTEHSGPFGPRYRCWCGPVWVGEVLVSVGSISAAFGGDDKTQEGEWRGDIPTLDEAKAWVEEQARAWLKEVTA